MKLCAIQTTFARIEDRPTTDWVLTGDLRLAGDWRAKVKNAHERLTYIFPSTKCSRERSDDSCCFLCSNEITRSNRIVCRTLVVPQCQVVLLHYRRNVPTSRCCSLFCSSSHLNQIRCHGTVVSLRGNGFFLYSGYFPSMRFKVFLIHSPYTWLKV